MTARSPRPLSPAQREVLQLAAAGHVRRSLSSEASPWITWAGRNNVTATVEALIRAGLLETGPFVALGTPRLAIVTDAGRRMLEQITAEAEAS